MVSTSKISRRKFLMQLGVGAACLGGGAAYAVWGEPRWVEVTRTKIPITGLPVALDGFAILQMSDFHHGKYVSAEYLRDCVELANRQNAQMIALTGDFVTGGRYYGRYPMFNYRVTSAEKAQYLERCIEILGQLRAPHGIFATLGNHDGWFDAERVSAEIRHMNWRLLRDENAVVRVGDAKLQVIGLRDMWTEQIDLSRAFNGINPSLPTVVLMHNPDLFPDAAEYGPALILAGHTHGGQVSLPLIGPPLVPSRFGAKYAAGLFQIGKTRMYVNRGLGVIAPPVRFGVRPEISVFELTRGEVSS
jgi:predicted MPP superfamily phosphohydrolase